MPEMIDLRGSKIVEVEISDDWTLWVNVDGVCRLRIQDIKIALAIRDARKEQDVHITNPSI